MASLALAFDLLARDNASPVLRNVGDASERAGSRLSKLGPLAVAGMAAVGTSVLGAGAALFKLGSNFDDAYDHIRVTTGATGASLLALQGDFKQVVQAVPTDFGSASDAIATLNQRLGLTGKPLQTLSEQFLEVSRLTGTDLKANIDKGTAALNAFGVKGSAQPAILDQLFRASQASGVSFTDLASQLTESGTQLRAVGFDVSESSALIATLGKAGLSTSDVMPALAKSMAVAAKEGKNAKTVFQETFDRIKSAPNDTAAAGVALDVFGAKGGPKLAAMIREGKLSISDMLKTVTGGSDTIMKAGADTEDFAEKWTKLKNRVFVGLEPIASKLFSAIGDGMDKLSAGFAGKGPIDGFSGSLNTLALGLRALVLAFQDGDVTSNGFVGQMEQAGVSARAAFEFFKTSVLPVLKDFAGFLTGSVVPAVASVVGWFVRHKGVTEALAAAVGALLIVTKVHAAFLAVEAVGGLRAYILQVNLVQVVTKVWAAAQWLLNAALTANPIGLVIVGLAALAVGLIYAYKHSETFRNIVQGAFHAVADAATFLWDHALKYLFAVWKLEFEIAWKVAQTLASVAGAAFKAVGDAASFMWTGVIRPVFKFLVDAWFTVVGAIVHGAAAAFGWVPGVGGKLKEAAAAFDGFRAAVDQQLAATAADAAGFGAQAGQLFADGIGSRTGAVAAAAHGLGLTVGNYLKQQSPAKLGPLSERGGTHGWGRDLAALFADGMTSNVARVGGASARLAGAVGLGGAPSLSRPVGVPAGGQGPSGAGLHIHGDINVIAAKDEPAAVSLPRALSNLAHVNGWGGY